MWAVIKAMHFDTPEPESTPGEYMALINEIDVNDPMREQAETAIDEILEILKSHGIARQRFLKLCSIKSTPTRPTLLLHQALFRPQLPPFRRFSAMTPLSTVFASLLRGRII